MGTLNCKSSFHSVPSLPESVIPMIIAASRGYPNTWEIEPGAPRLITDFSFAGPVSGSV